MNKKQFWATAWKTATFVTHWFDAALVIGLLLYLILGSRSETYSAAFLGGLVFAIWVTRRNNRQKQVD